MKDLTKLVISVELGDDEIVELMAKINTLIENEPQLQGLITEVLLKLAKKSRRRD